MAMQNQMRTMGNQRVIIPEMPVQGNLQVDEGTPAVPPHMNDLRAVGACPTIGSCNLSDVCSCCCALTCVSSIRRDEHDLVQL